MDDEDCNDLNKLSLDLNKESRLGLDEQQLKRKEIDSHFSFSSWILDLKRRVRLAVLLLLSFLLMISLILSMLDTASA